MRIVLAHPFVWPEVRRGAERYVDDLAWFLAGRGHEVELVTGTEGPTRCEQRPDGIVVHHRHHVGLRKLGRLGVDRVQSFLLTALPVLRSRDYDVAHAMVPAGSLAANLARLPVAFTFIGHPTRDQYDALTGLDRRLHRTASRRATATTALSVASATAVEALFGRRPVVLAPGIRLDRFRPALDARTGPPRLLFSAAPGDRRKRLDLLLQAMPTLLDHHPDARVLVSGQGDPGWAFDAVPAGARERVRASVELLGPGSADDIPERYRTATLTVLPAVHEAFGLALVESLASGTPVVATADGGMLDIVTDDAVGATFPEASPVALADALVEVIDRARRSGTAASCAAHARRWGWQESIGPEHERLYERLAG